ncbi:MAG: type II toxin-antitoxin system ParD family antitoxin [Moraxellaceae bacterium]|nr:MAG: type II toxin-antitoxin system ParD family antitoxin [Moraxellaceae bacterium]
MNLNLGKDLEAYISQKVATDITYNNASEWVREAIREKIKSDREYFEQLEALKADIDVGLEQIEKGQFADLDFDALMKETN